MVTVLEPTDKNSFYTAYELKELRYDEGMANNIIALPEENMGFDRILEYVKTLYPDRVTKTMSTGGRSWRWNNVATIAVWKSPRIDGDAEVCLQRVMLEGRIFVDRTSASGIRELLEPRRIPYKSDQLYVYDNGIVMRDYENVTSVEYSPTKALQMKKRGKPREKKPRVHRKLLAGDYQGVANDLVSYVNKKLHVKDFLSFGTSDYVNLYIGYRPRAHPIHMLVGLLGFIRKHPFLSIQEALVTCIERTPLDIAEILKMRSINIIKSLAYPNSTDSKEDTAARFIKRMSIAAIKHYKEKQQCKTNSKRKS